MPKLIEVKVPAIGDFKNIPIIDVLVKARRHGAAGRFAGHAGVGQSDAGCACARAGVVKDLKIKVGDKVSEGSLI
jgi:hypothetical protein